MALPDSNLTPGRASVSRQKACLACTRAKRRCDKHMPCCERCQEFELTCTYPQRKRRRVPDPELEAEPDSESPEYVPPLSAAPPSPPRFPGVTCTRTGILPSFTDDLWDSNTLNLFSSMPPSCPTTLVSPSMSIAGASSWTIPRPLENTLSETTSSSTETLWQPTFIQSIDNTNKTSAVTHTQFPGSWFLHPSTWTLTHSPSPSEPQAFAGYIGKAFIAGTQATLRTFLRTGSCACLHERLFQTPQGVPDCLQDAFSALAAYEGRTPKTEDLALRILERRAEKLSENGGKAVGHELEAADTRTAIARFVSLFIYIIIGLFDGDVRMRARSEKLIPLLHSWGRAMLQSAAEGSVADYLQLGGRAQDQSTSSSSLGTCPLATPLWHAWVLTESARRSWMLGVATTNCYLTMRDGWAACEGGNMFTARKGLWECGSAHEWCSRWESEDPLFVSSIQPADLIGRVGPDEVDDFACHFYGIVLGTGELENWLARRKTVVGMGVSMV